MPSSVSLCVDAFISGLRPEPDVLVSEWAEEFRFLTQTSAAEPGRWRNERTPYLIEPMDALSTYSGVEQVSVIKGAQGGWTEACANAIGYTIHKAPGPMMYIQPTVDTAKRFSRTRLAPMIESCAPLRERIKDSKSRDSSNTVMMKDFPGGVLILGGANSAAALRSAPIRVLLMDEVDAYPQDVDGEGDPIELAEKRTSTFRNRKIFKFGTPTLVGLSHIEKAFKAGDQRQWHVPCPHCKAEQVLHWRFEDDQPGGLIWERGKPETAKYQCQHCLELIAEHHKTWMNANGRWIPSRTEGVDPKIRSYHWPSLYSPYGWPGSSWAELAKKWEVGHGDPTKLKAFFNLELGLPYEDKASRSAEPHVLMDRCANFPLPLADGTAVVPNEIALITLGADVQNNRIEYEVVGWGKGEESYSLLTGVIAGDTTTTAPFTELDRVLLQRFKNEAGLDLIIKAACIDSNFNTQTVTTWCGPRFNRRVWAVRGKSGPRAIWPRMPGHSKYNRTPQFTLGVDSAKSAIVGRLSIDEPGPGYCHFPTGRDESFFQQITSEICVTVYDKIPPYNVWKKKVAHARNEALDCRVYAYAGLCGLIAGGFNLDSEATRIGLLVSASLANLQQPLTRPANNRAPRFSMAR